MEVLGYSSSYESGWGTHYLNIEEIYSPICERVIFTATEEDQIAIQSPYNESNIFSSNMVTVYDSNYTPIITFYQEYPIEDGFDCEGMYGGYWAPA